MSPDLLIVGQMTIDHIVPATPSLWYEALGGNALYGAAGARLWLDPFRIGIVARRGPNLPPRIDALLAAAGLTNGGLKPVPDEHLTEWMIYETDGSRRNLPRAPELRGLHYDAIAGSEAYLARKAAISATVEDIPVEWRAGARAIHLAPQVRDRHPASLAALAETIPLISVDPSPTCSNGLNARQLAQRLSGAKILLPSQAEVYHLNRSGNWHDVARSLVNAGFPEVVVKMGGEGVAVCTDPSHVERVPALPVNAVDLTGAGDAFCGAYTANRLLGHDPVSAARRAVVSAAMIVECSGVDAALAIDPAEARRRFDEGDKDTDHD